MLRVVTDDDARAEMRSAIDEICAEGARRMLAAALEAEVDAYITALADERDERGRRLVVRIGHAEARTLTTGRERSRCRRRGWMTAGSIRRPVSGPGSAARSSRRGAAAAPRSPRCCR